LKFGNEQAQAYAATLDDTVEISIKDFLALPPSAGKHNLFQTRTDAIDFPPRSTDLVLDPWLVGMWLGAGFPSIDPDVIDDVWRTHNIKIDTNEFLAGLRTYNLINNKHIPDDYKYGSRETRLRVLAGLLDTDGHLDSRFRTSYEITQKSTRLANDIVFVARSLGFAASIRECIHITGDVDQIPVVLGYKRAIPRERNTNELMYAFDVTYVGVEDYYGVEVDGNNRIVHEDFTVLHNSGKGQCLADLLYHKRHIPMGILMSSTEEATGFFQKTCGIPDTYIYGDWQPGVIDTIIAKQKKLSKHGKMRNIFIVLDDLAFNKALFLSKQMRELMFNGRHYGIMLVITAQYLMDLPTYFRSNVDYVITTRTPGIQDRERLYKNFFGVVPSFNMFQSIMDSTTEDYHVLMVDNTSQSNALEDNIFWYKAPLRGPNLRNFKIGCPAYHQYANKHAKKEDDEPGPSSSSKRPMVKIKKIGR